MKNDQPVIRGTLLGAVWALPVFGALLTVSTVTHQPDFTADFAAYADYVTGSTFVPSHLVASILGAALGIIGTVAAALVVASTAARPRRALAGAGLSIVGHVLNVSVFGVAAFAQPAIGRAYKRGDAEIVAVNSDVYGPELIGTVLFALVFWTAGAVVLGRAFRAADPSLRTVGTAYASTLTLFYVTGPFLSVAQPFAGAAFTVAAVLLARRLPSATRTPQPERDVDRAVRG